jgi:hypothetical protein
MGVVLLESHRQVQTLERLEQLQTETSYHLVVTQTTMNEAFCSTIIELDGASHDSYSTAEE